MKNLPVDDGSSIAPLSNELITHYGLFWKTADILWSGHKGSLLGKGGEPLGRRGAPTLEQRDKAIDYKKYVGLYCFYGEGELIYVGEAGLKEASSKRTLYSRLKEHRKGSLSERWDSFSWFGREMCQGSVSARQALQQLEAVVIAIINPGFNKQSGVFFWR